MTITEAFEAYRLDCILFRNQSRKTEEQHIYAMKSLVRFAGDIEFSDLSFNIVRQWKSSLEIRNLAPNTMRGYIIKLRNVLKYARLKNDVCLNPDAIPVPKRGANKTRVKFVPASDVLKLIEACDSPGNKHINRARNKAIVALLFSSGIRVSEICRLNREDVRENFFTVTSKGGADEVSFIDTNARKYIDEYLKKRKDKHQALFVADKKGYPRISVGSVQEVFKTLKRHTGLQVKPHTMRHSFATDLMKNGADIRYVQKLMHHKSIQTTQQYLHVLDEEMHELHDRFHSELSVVDKGWRDPAPKKDMSRR